MKYAEDTSIYFRLPATLKKDFDHICSSDRTTKTHMLNTLIRGLINEKISEDRNLYERPRNNRGRWLSRSEYQR
jgi:hypothetical protein